MRNACIIILLGVTCCNAVFSQSLIKGRVVDAATGEPLAGSTIFINSTSIGTVSNSNGYFELTSAPAGRHELIISSVGYETNVFAFTSDQLPLQLKIEMAVKVKELENVTVEPYTVETWEKWGKLFTENFIGLTPNAKQCRIRNHDVVEFRFYKKSNRLVAYADKPIIIDNRALGYTIRYQLEQFEVDFKGSVSTYAGYPFFEDMVKREKGKRRWEKPRQKAYFGSMMHFVRSLYKDSLVQNGYEVTRMAKVPNQEYERVTRLYRAAMDSQIKIARAKGVMVTQPPKLDSLDYYQRIMRQNRFTEVYGKDILTADSVVVKTEKGEKVLYFPNYLFITYKGAFEDKAYLEHFGERRSPTFQRSYIWLVDMEPVIIDANGNYYPPQALFSSAYWGWGMKMADTLPLDY